MNSLWIILLVGFGVKISTADMPDPRFGKLIDEDLSKELHKMKKQGGPPDIPYFTSEGEEILESILIREIRQLEQKSHHMTNFRTLLHLPDFSKPKPEVKSKSKHKETAKKTIARGLPNDLKVKPEVKFKSGRKAEGLPEYSKSKAELKSQRGRTFEGKPEVNSKAGRIPEVSSKNGNRTQGLPEDLLGESVVVQSRQLGKSTNLQGQDGKDIGFKDPGEFVPWKRPIGVPTEPPEESSTTEEPPITLKPKPKPNDPDLVEVFNRLMPKYTIRASSLYGACGAPGGRTCFAYPEGCIETRTCRVAGAIFEEDTDPTWFKISLAATAPHGFVSIAFSEDRFMGDDIVVSCNHIPSGPQMTLHLGYNKGYATIMQTNKKKFEATLSAIAGFVQSNSVIACEFDMSTNVFLDHSKAGISMLDKSYHIFLAFGRYYDALELNDTDFGTLMFHHMAIVSEEKVKLTEIFKTPVILHPRGRFYILLHVIPYILAFSFFVPCAIYISKYGREGFSNLLTSKQIPKWIFIHVVFLIIAIILSIIGLIGILIELDWKWRSITGKAIFHSVFGIFATVLNILNAIFGHYGLKGQLYPGNAPPIVAPDAQSDKRTHYIKWMHWYFGNCVYIFGMGCLFIAPYMRRAHAPCLFQYVVTLQIFVHVMAEIIMSFHTYWLVGILDGKELYRRILPGPMIPWTQADLPQASKVDNFNQMDIWLGRKRAVFFYFITSGICCIGLIGLLFVPLVLCRQTLNI